MNNENMLKIAKGMGFLVAYQGSGENIDCIEIINGWNTKSFNPTEGELIEWLLEKGFIDLITTSCIEFEKIYDSNSYLNYNSRKGTLKENLLSIVLQVIESEEKSRR